MKKDLKKSEVGVNLNLFKRVDDLELSVRSQNCLKSANIDYIIDLVILTEQDLLSYANFGRKSCEEILKLLKEMDLSFGMKVDNQNFLDKNSSDFKKYVKMAKKL